MFKRYALRLSVLVLLLGSWGSTPSGQGSAPKISGDLLKLAHGRGAHTHRVIVQTSV